MPIIQEYIPGGRKQQFRILLDKEGETKVAFSERRWRNFSRISSEDPPVVETIIPPQFVEHAARLVHKIGWWGGATVQTIIDPRDGIPKLMEVNPRLGYKLWYRTELGINEPRMCLLIAVDKKVKAIKDYPTGILLIEPLEDFIALSLKLLDLLVFNFRIRILRKSPIDSSNPPMGLKALFRSYKQTYLGGKKKIFNPYFTYFFQDPLVSVLYWFQFFTHQFKVLKQLGK